MLWTRAHVDDVAGSVLAALDNRAADGLAVNVGERRVFPIRTWFQQVLDAARSTAVLTQVANGSVPPDLSISKDHPQHLLASVQRAHELLGWSANDPVTRIEQSVRWHLDSSRLDPWTATEQDGDAAALQQRTTSA